jgi:transketolase
VVFDDKYKFEFGKAQIIREGDDLTIFAIGLMVAQSLKAAEWLEKEGINAQVVNVSTVKPIDKETIISCVSKTDAAVTAEEHLVTGGLGSAIAEVLAEGFPAPLERIGLKEFGQSGSAEELIAHYGLTPEGIAKAAIRALKRKESR